LLWIVSLSTLILIILQHNAAHLGIATGLCISEAASIHLPKPVSVLALSSAVLATAFTALAEILGGAIALQMLFQIPLRIGSILILGLIVWLLFSNSYRLLERYVIGFVSLIGFSFIFELSITPIVPTGSVVILLSVLGAVVMPHNLFLHSEIIQSRQWNLKNEKIIKHQLRYEFMDTAFAMFIGWAINSAMFLIAARIFFHNKIPVTEIGQAQVMLKPLLGNAAALVFAIALLFAGIASSVTAGMAGGSIFAGIYKEPYDIKDRHSKTGVLITLLLATFLIMFISNPFKGLIYSQILLSIQLPITIMLQVYLTSSKKVMGEHANTLGGKFLLGTAGLFVIVMNVLLFIQIFKSI
jgi:manganese transport protein